MRKIRFGVPALPPKKDGANSMWGKEIEARRLIALRKAAHQALRTEPPFTRGIRLTVRIRMSPGEKGDLDNFVAGLCDGLMHAHPLAGLHPSFGRPENAEVHPHFWCALQDDDAIVKIVAEKHSGIGPSAYRIELAGE